MAEDPKETVRRLAAQAGIPLAEEELAALAQTLPALRATSQALAEADLGEREPALIFRPPKGQPR